MSLFVLSMILSLSGAVDCSMIILYSTANIHLSVSTYHICLSVSGLLHSKLFFSSSINLPSNGLVPLLLTSSLSFRVTGFMLRSLIHLDLNFVQSNRYGSIFILLQTVMQLCQHQLFSLFHCIILASLSRIGCS